MQDQLETWEPCCLESGTVSQWKRWVILLGNLHQDQSQSAIDVDVVSDLLENAWEARAVSNMGNSCWLTHSALIESRDTGRPQCGN